LKAKMSSIPDRLSKLFDKHRIVFWYDALQELCKDFENVELEGVEKQVVNNNEFGIKVLVLQKKPQQKFLLYFPSTCPSPRENWLLDLLLCHGELRTDPMELMLQDLEMDRDYSSVIEEHFAFFKSKERRQKFKLLLQQGDSDSKLRMNMLAVLCGTPPDAEVILFHLFRELNEIQSDIQTSFTTESIPGDTGGKILKFGLEPYFWMMMERHYGYRSGKPSLIDFLIRLLRCSLGTLEKESSELNSEAKTFLNHWKDSQLHHGTFRSLADRMASESYLNIKQVLNQPKPVEELLDLDTFREIEQKILYEIKEELLRPAPQIEILKRWIESRRNTHWQETFGNEYMAMVEAIKLMEMLSGSEISLSGVDEGLKKYLETYYRFDLHYRRYSAAADNSGKTELFNKLNQRIEKLYVNQFLIPLNELWQEKIERQGWKSGVLPSQRDFHELYVMPFLRKQKKVFVLISDALRFECAVELKEMIIGKDRYQAKLDAMLGVLPSYTQLGMAALLPHKNLEMSADGQKVEADGKSTQGLEARLNVLKTKHGDRVTALHLKDFMMLDQESGRALTREHDVVYLFHNQIDQTGDDSKSEHLVFQAVAETQKELLRAFNRISAFNGNNILLTSDHGFLYQKLALQENDFISVDAKGEGLAKLSRRFISGKGMGKNPELWNLDGASLNLSGDLELQFPRGIHRLKKSGAGRQFVHGGPSLQEIVIPCLTIKKIRASDTSPVTISILNQQSMITTNQVTVSFYQDEPVGEKVLPRTVKAGFYRKSGELISDTYEFTFDKHESESTLREIKKTFVFKRTLENHLECVLRLTSKIEGAQQYSPYKEFSYTLNKTFDGDFDL